MHRIRIKYSKRGMFCFIRHVELPQVLSRAARRAEIPFVYTEGFSPHPKVSLGPALPVGVVALNEPADVWLEEEREDLVQHWNRYLPQGFSIQAAREVEGLALNKLCTAASYWFAPRDSRKVGQMEEALTSNPYPASSMLSWRRDEDGFEAAIANPSQTGPSSIVKFFRELDLIAGWPDICIVRLNVGCWKDEEATVVPVI